MFLHPPLFILPTDLKFSFVRFEMPERWVELARQGHLGLVGMLERAETINGQLQVVSTPGKGTAIRVAVPWGDKPATTIELMIGGRTI